MAALPFSGSVTMRNSAHEHGADFFKKSFGYSMLNAFTLQGESDSQRNTGRLRHSWPTNTLRYLAVSFLKEDTS
ncbi:MAG: hypothetical protein B6D63_07070 [Candidatus Latescibacteria bacterium 4484_7]|nr:MAG: hypothetical protein B6D63_07070 [Candidatus Latescibacteria bacterium 4484_7]